MEWLIDPPEVGASQERWDAFIADLKTIQPRTPAIEIEIARAEEDLKFSIELWEIDRLQEEALRDPYWGPLLTEARQHGRETGDWTRADQLRKDFVASRQPPA